MKYFKYNYSQLDWNSRHTKIINDFTNLGFYDKDCKSIKLQDNEYITLKWKYDNKNSFYCNMALDDDLDYYPKFDFHPTYSNNLNGFNYFFGAITEYTGTKTDPRFIFLPLKDNGFFLNGRQHNTSSTNRGYNEYSSVDIDFDFTNNFTDIRGGRDGFDLIALPSNKPGEFYYLYGSPGYDFLYNQGDYNFNTVMDMNYGNVKILCQCYSYDFDRYWNTDFILPLKFGRDYNDYINPHKEDVCTLGHIYTKDTQEKINNLYLLIDKPNQITTRSIFTIGGRTFFCFSEPFVIELPNN